MQLTSPVALCLKVVAAQAASQRGTAAQWTISAWATGGHIPDATIRLQATPEVGGAPGFSFGCGSGNGTSWCHLGLVNPASAPRQLQAELTVPVDASSVSSVSLTVTGSATHLAKEAQASAAVNITAPSAPQTSSGSTGASASTGPSSPATSPAPAGSATPTTSSAPSATSAPATSSGAGEPTAAATPTGAAVPTGDAPPTGEAVPTGDAPPTAAAVPTGEAVPAQGSVPSNEQGPVSSDQGSVPSTQAAAPQTSPLPVSSLPSLPDGSSSLPAVPGVPAASPSLSPGGNAAGLFPTLDPKPAPSSGVNERARPVANTSALPEGAPVADAQLAGLAALALAFALTVTRLSLRRRGGTPLKQPADTSAEADGKPADPAGDAEPTTNTAEKDSAEKAGSTGEPPAGSADTPGDASEGA